LCRSLVLHTCCIYDSIAISCQNLVPAVSICISPKEHSLYNTYVVNKPITGPPKIPIGVMYDSTPSNSTSWSAGWRIVHARQHQTGRTAETHQNDAQKNSQSAQSHCRDESRNQNDSKRYQKARPTRPTHRHTKMSKSNIAHM
jgi:hypothetical protein